MSRQLRFLPSATGSYSRFSDSSSCVPFTNRNLESTSPCSCCQLTTIFPLSSLESVCPQSTATISPSLINGLIEDPRTRKQFVSSGFGHHRSGAASISLTSTVSRSSTWSPLAPCVAACAASTGIATSRVFLVRLPSLFCAPAATISSSGNFVLRSTPCPSGNIRDRSLLLNPARPQNHQLSGSPAIFPSCM